MHKTLSSLFWDFYAFCYDGVRELKPYQDMLEEVLKELDLKPGMKVLDAGCGTGNLEALIAERHPGVEVVAVDFSPEMLKRAKKKNNACDISFVKADLNVPLQFQSTSFDRVVCVNMFHSAKDVSLLCAELSRVLAPDGIIVLVTSKKGSSVSQIFNAHLREKGKVFTDNRDALSVWICQIFHAFGFSSTAFRLIVVAILNWMLVAAMREYNVVELSTFCNHAGISPIRVGLTYANQAILLRLFKSEILGIDGIKFKIASSQEEKTMAYRLRYEGYCLDLRGIDTDHCIDGLERDEYDNVAIHLIAIQGERAIGVMRLVPPCHGKMPMEKYFRWPADVSRESAIEFSRLYVLPEKRGGDGYVMRGLFKLAMSHARSIGYQYFCMAALPQPLHIFYRWNWKMHIFDDKKRIKMSEHFTDEFTPLMVSAAETDVPFSLIS